MQLGSPELHTKRERDSLKRTKSLIDPSSDITVHYVNAKGCVQNNSDTLDSNTLRIASMSGFFGTDKPEAQPIVCTPVVARNKPVTEQEDDTTDDEVLSAAPASSNFIQKISRTLSKVVRGKSLKKEHPEPFFIELSALAKISSDVILIQVVSWNVGDISIGSKLGNQPWNNLFSPRADILFVNLQEVQAGELPFVKSHIQKFLQTFLQERVHCLGSTSGELSGFGGNAVFHKKCTANLVFVKDRVTKRDKFVSPKDAMCMSVNVINRSKGVCATALKVFDRKLLLIGCHLPAANAAKREMYRNDLKKGMSSFFNQNGCFGGGKSIEEQFDHIVWCGDFNFRIQLPSKQALALVSSPQKLLRHDESRTNNAADMKKWREPKIVFPPTYKLKVLREPKKELVADRYQLKKKSRLRSLFGFENKERTPSYTDRIFLYGDTEKFAVIQDSYRSCIELDKNHLFNSSDHDPVTLEAALVK